MIYYEIDEYGIPLVQGGFFQSISPPIIPPMPIGGTPRSSKWAKFLLNLLNKNPKCWGCNKKSQTGHHDKPFHEFPELELEESNIDIVCVPCHFVLCHAGNWKLYVPDARKRLAWNLKNLKDNNFYDKL